MRRRVRIACWVVFIVADIASYVGITYLLFK